MVAAPDATPDFCSASSANDAGGQTHIDIRWCKSNDWNLGLEMAQKRQELQGASSGPCSEFATLV